MFESDTLKRWVGAQVVDSSGHHIGDLHEVLVAPGGAQWAVIRRGSLRPRSDLVPAAAIREDHGLGGHADDGAVSRNASKRLIAGSGPPGPPEHCTARLLWKASRARADQPATRLS